MKGIEIEQSTAYRSSLSRFSGSSRRMTCGPMTPIAALIVESAASLCSKFFWTLNSATCLIKGSSNPSAAVGESRPPLRKRSRETSEEMVANTSGTALAYPIDSSAFVVREMIFPSVDFVFSLIANSAREGVKQVAIRSSDWTIDFRVVGSDDSKRAQRACHNSPNLEVEAFGSAECKATKAFASTLPHEEMSMVSAFDGGEDSTAVIMSGSWSRMSLTGCSTGIASSEARMEYADWER